MNNCILINQTFVNVTYESADNGDYSDSGFIAEKLEVSFRELVQLMKDHCHPSQSPNNGSTDIWYSSDFHTINFKTGEEQETAIHYYTENTPNAAKYWRLARKFADKKR